MPSQASPEADSTTGIRPAAPWRVKAVSVLPDYRLAVTFLDGRSGTLDCSAVKGSGEHGIYAALADPEFFARVRIDLGVLCWPNGADFDPAWIYEELGRQKMWSVPV